MQLRKPKITRNLKRDYKKVMVLRIWCKTKKSQGIILQMYYACKIKTMWEELHIFNKIVNVYDVLFSMHVCAFITKTTNSTNSWPNMLLHRFLSFLPFPCKRTLSKHYTEHPKTWNGVVKSEKMINIPGIEQQSQKSPEKLLKNIPHVSQCNSFQGKYCL